MSLQEQPADRGDHFDGGPVAFNGFTYTDEAHEDPEKKTVTIEYTVQWQFYNLTGTQILSTVWSGTNTAAAPDPIKADDYQSQAANASGAATAVSPVMPPKPTPDAQDGVVLQILVRGKRHDGSCTTATAVARGQADTALQSAEFTAHPTRDLTGQAHEVPWHPAA